MNQLLFQNWRNRSNRYLKLWRIINCLNAQKSVVHLCKTYITADFIVLLVISLAYYRRLSIGFLQISIKYYELYWKFNYYWGLGGQLTSINFPGSTGIFGIASLFLNTEYYQF